MQASCIGEALTRLGCQVSFLPFVSNLEAVRCGLRGLRPDLVFNLVETVRGTGRLIHLAPGLLDVEGLPYTGCPTEALFCTSHKVLAKWKRFSWPTTWPTKVLTWGRNPAIFSSLRKFQVRWWATPVTGPLWERPADSTFIGSWCIRPIRAAVSDEGFLKRPKGPSGMPEADGCRWKRRRAPSMNRPGGFTCVPATPTWPPFPTSMVLKITKSSMVKIFTEGMAMARCVRRGDVIKDVADRRRASS
ncbi:hypothetical protein EDC27_2438 [Desulfosoma caldarium]|uniref:Uncharacterized protein n=1 Tax=Desulfosoma caldarium TaxID=610254 RepID=A0A3N1UIS6_9BACT|nr:hypothetical protein EDC27_2438 [Desulfosoma caldarium]